MCIYPYTCIYTCIYVYMYICIYIYIHILNIHVYIDVQIYKIRVYFSLFSLPFASLLVALFRFALPRRMTLDSFVAWPAWASGQCSCLLYKVCIASLLGSSGLASSFLVVATYRRVLDIIAKWTPPLRAAAA